MAKENGRSSTKIEKINFLKYPFFVFIGLLIFSCSSTSNTNISSLKESVVSMQKTQCFGRCPAYTFTIFNNLDCELKPRVFAFIDSNSTGVISQSQLDSIFLLANQIDFWNLKEVYDTKGITDLPSTIFKIKEGNREKKIINRHKGPESLNKLEKYIEKVAKSVKWKNN